MYAEDMYRWTGRDPVPPPAGSPRASGLIELAGVGDGLRRLDDVAASEPDYGRLAEAQVRWKKRMEDPCLIRSATKADVPALVAMERRVFSDPWSASAFTALLGRHRWWP